MKISRTDRPVYDTVSSKKAMKRTSFILIIVSLLMLSSCSGDQTNDDLRYFNCLEVAAGTIPTLSRSELDWPTADLIEVCLSASYDSVFNSILFYRNVYQLNTKTGETVSNALEQEATDDWGRNFRVPKDAFYDAWREFNGLQELETRPDAASCLLARYRQSEFGDYQTRILEVLLSEEVYFNQLTEAERTILYETLEAIYGADRSKAATDGSDQSYRFYPYYPIEENTAE